MSKTFVASCVLLFAFPALSPAPVFDAVNGNGKLTEHPVNGPELNGVVPQVGKVFVREAGTPIEARPAGAPGGGDNIVRSSTAVNGSRNIELASSRMNHEETNPLVRAGLALVIGLAGFGLAKRFLPIFRIEPGNRFN